MSCNKGGEMSSTILVSRKTLNDCRPEKESSKNEREIDCSSLLFRFKF